MKEQTTNFNQKRAENPFVKEVQTLKQLVKIVGESDNETHTSRISIERCGDEGYKSTALR